MSDRAQAVKGMNDLLPPDSAKWAHVERVARDVFERHGYREIRTPLVEYTPLFVRSIGEATDVVEKEMYTWTDRDGQSITLRPEGTASVVRAYLEHDYDKRDLQQRFYYSGPMFRHERAQKGRYRQFYQLGVEALGVGEATLDAEQVAMLVKIFEQLGVPNLQMAVNSVGGPEDRGAYREKLKAFFEPFRAQLCEDCQRRLERNALRVLDCKKETDQKIARDAPSILDSIGPTWRAHFERFQAALATLEVPFAVDPRLVRGLDYYTGTTFELRETGGELGSQNTICGGGRYDRLVEELGGPVVPAVGFAFGIERAVMSMPATAASFERGPDCFVIGIGESAKTYCLRLAARLRAEGFSVELDHKLLGDKPSKQAQRAEKRGARVALTVGDNELAARQVAVKVMVTREQTAVAEDALVAALRERLGR
jgi:histidyl-tRNA synthetase